MQLGQIKKLAINAMIASLIGAAGIAVVAVLIGEFSDVLGKSLFTLLIVTVHALACLGFLGRRSGAGSNDDTRFFTNTLFVLIVLSFITSVFGIWELLAMSIVGKLYATYFVMAFASLHGEMLAKALGLEAKITNIVYVNYLFMAVVILMLLPLIWLPDTDFPAFYYRLLAAAAIVDTTLTILAVILNKLYLQKHPEVKSQLFAQVQYVVDANGNKVPQAVPTQRRTHPLLILLGIFLLLQVIGPIFYYVAGLWR